ncbi:MAG: NAD-dependent epimerase/dehydratase family protein [Planctomycetia bacterium]
MTAQVPKASALAGQRVFVTGGHGFLGQPTCQRLAQAGADVLAPTRARLDLLQMEPTCAAVEAARPQVIVHLAANVGGIGANQRHPGAFWRDNLLMGVHVMEAARRAGVKRVVVVGTVCAYPKFTPVPFVESSLWDGFPEETNAPYGVAKRALLTGLEAYRQEFGVGGAYLLPANMYGPHDDFDLETSHVIPAMLRKCEEARLAGQHEVVLWGTGSATREFLYVDDCAEALVLAAAGLDDPAPINLGTGREVSMRDLAAKVAAATGFTGAFRWDSTRPDGQPRRALDARRARKRLGWQASTTLEQGLSQAVTWYRAHGPHRARVS